MVRADRKGATAPLRGARAICLLAVLLAVPVHGSRAEAPPGSGSPPAIRAPEQAATAVAQAHFADAEDAAAVKAGRQLYRTYCARCHGRRLEGQALWQLRDAYFHQRAPAHDETGHTWQHSDEALFQITASGRMPGMPADGHAAMPAYARVLDETQILQVLAYIKARWPVGLRIAQAMLNPDFAGMPAGAQTAEWTLPPGCSALQEWRTGAK